MPDTCFTENPEGALELTALPKAGFDAWFGGLSDTAQAWIKTSGFKASPGTVCLLPGDICGDTSSDAGGDVQAVAGYSDTSENLLWDWAAIAKALPAGKYRISTKLDEDEAATCMLGWALSQYSFDRYQQKKDKDVDKASESDRVLVWPEGANHKQALSHGAAISLVRNLINTPANHMGPAELADVAGELAAMHDGTCVVISGEALLEADYPAIHAVGRASDMEPCLIDLAWGNENAPKVTLVGKGVCFDSGGLDLKPASSMKLMKKDMGGSAQALGLASMIMEAGIKVRLRVLIPAVENAVSGNAMRPLDVVDTRKGLTIEIGNTDAEGRVILADALFEATSEQPDLIIDFATLTGAARVALGTELPALFCNSNEVAEDILACGMKVSDPMWRLPLWPGYKKLVEGKVADLNNAPEGGFGGAITAALFLEHFVSDENGNVSDWVHLDLMAWNQSSRPGRPEGGEAMTIRALFTYLSERFGM
ncbi:MAG: leucyl aminopeptidase family protein [Alphaproteobacteria bacterium]|nr:leucyl aminopeptidase family protein [Alphaproteobacteria bacterium]